MKLSTNGLRTLLASHVVELRFRRRRLKIGWSVDRRMLCTNSGKLLNSIPGKIALGFKPPKGVGLRYNPSAKNLVVAYDLLWQDFRQISVESNEVITAIPVQTDEEINTFWEYFNKRLRDMSSGEKIKFMNQ